MGKRETYSKFGTELHCGIYQCPIPGYENKASNCNLSKQEMRNWLQKEGIPLVMTC
jgi:hypothetical protein